VYFGVSARNLQTQLGTRTDTLEQRVEAVAQDSERISAHVGGWEGQAERRFAIIDAQLGTLQARFAKPTNAAPDKVSGGAKKEAPAGPGGVHAIKSGDTLGSVAKKYGVSLDALLKANPGLDSRRLKIGQKVKIPGAAPTGAAQ
jgi:LysM repeat protein